jgi:hypothetical protein
MDPWSSSLKSVKGETSGGKWLNQSLRFHYDKKKRITAPLWKQKLSCICSHFLPAENFHLSQVDSTGLWRWYMTLMITWLLDFANGRRLLSQAFVTALKSITTLTSKMLCSIIEPKVSYYTECPRFSANILNICIVKITVRSVFTTWQRNCQKFYACYLFYAAHMNVRMRQYTGRTFCEQQRELRPKCSEMETDGERTFWVAVSCGESRTFLSLFIF